MSNCILYNLNSQITATGSLGIATIRDEKLIRFVIENAGLANQVVVRCRITGQSDWDVLQTITGNAKINVNVSAYDEIEVLVTVYSSASNYIKVLASSFNEAGDTTGGISLGVPAGDNLSDVSSINFTSSDNTISIEGNSGTSTIDFRVNSVVSSYVQSFNNTTDWTGPASGSYSLTILKTTHNKSNPTIHIYEATGSDFLEVETGVRIDSSENVIITVNSSPDLRFVGKIVIL